MLQHIGGIIISVEFCRNLAVVSAFFCSNKSCLDALIRLYDIYIFRQLPAGSFSCPSTANNI